MRVIVVSQNNIFSDLIKSYIDEDEKFSYLKTIGDYEKAFNAVKELKKCVVIIDISEYPEQGLNFTSKITSECPECRVVVTSDKYDTDLIIRAIRLGACDFVQIPIIKQKFSDALNKVYVDITGKAIKQSKCRVISVYSNKGGIGKTSIATNLALELAKTSKENVALIDLNFQLGDITTFLNLSPTFNISYMLENLNNLNSDFILSTFEKYENTSLYVLADSPYLKQSEKVSTDKIEKLFNILRETFSYVIVDTSGGFDKRALKALEISDLVLFVTIVNLPAIRNCQRCLEFFDKNGLKDKIQIVVNRYMENDEINAQDVEKVLGKNLYWKIPNNYFTLMSAINKGVPVSKINPDSNVALSYKNLALMISDSIYKGANYVNR